MDVKKIVLEEFEKEGLKIAEDVAERVLEISLNVIAKIVVATENKIDDVALVILPVIKPYILAAIDDIDKSDNPITPVV